MTYGMDSYSEAAAECLLMVRGRKNVVAFGSTYRFILWTTSAGYERVYALAVSAVFFEMNTNLSAGLWSHGSHLAGSNAHG